jgi:phenylpropionate dioxygenase-like ring-hydroxylating dioxygenase large terminal subunit
MDRQLELGLIERVLGHLAANTADMADRGGGAPVEHYLSPERLQAEVSVLFLGFPIGLAHVDQLREVGDYVLREVVGRSILIVRGPDHRIRAFLNACRHRAAELVTAPCGRAKSLVCPYHAWTYGLDGRLLGMPGAEGFRHVAKADLGLTSFPVHVRHGCVWVVPTPGLAPDWDSWFAPVDRELADLDVDQHVVYRSRDLVVKANWKSVNDAFMEGYHFRVVHKNSVYPYYGDNQGAFDAMGPHYRYLLVHRNFGELAKLDVEARRLRPHCLMVYQLFPATSIHILPDHLFLHTLIPLDVGTCIVRNTMLIPQPIDSDKAEAFWQRNHDLVIGALDEDHAIAESTFRGLSSGANHDLVFGRFEQGLIHMHERTSEALRGALRLPERAQTAAADGASTTESPSGAVDPGL